MPPPPHSYSTLIEGCVLLWDILIAVPPPVITTHPESQMDVRQGSNITFSVDAEGLRLSFSWQRRDAPFASEQLVMGLDTRSLTIFQVEFEDAGLYACEVSNRAGSVLSRDAVLTVGECIAGVRPNPPFGSCYTHEFIWHICKPHPFN